MEKEISKDYVRIVSLDGEAEMNSEILIEISSATGAVAATTAEVAIS